MGPGGMRELLARTRPVLLDGAVGTELARRGIPTTLPLWSAQALTSDEGLRVLTAIETDYAAAGAEILVTNTFRTTLRALGRAGRGGLWRTVNERAVACARAGARSVPHPCLVAGGIAPLEDCYRPDLVPGADECRREHARQVELLVELGVDLLFLETMNAKREALAALHAAVSAGLDVLVSLCPRPPAALLSGEPLADALPELVAAGGARLRGILLNCASPEQLDEIYPRFAALAPEVPHGVYAHLGAPDPDSGWTLPEAHEPDRYARWMARRIDEGAAFVGGCCGTTPAHIAALARLLGARESSVDGGGSGR